MDYTQWLADSLTEFNHVWAEVRLTWLDRPMDYGVS